MKEMADVSCASLQAPTLEQTNAALPWSGIRALMLGVLEEAIQTLMSPNPLARAEVELWMTSRERRYVFSFAVICEALGLEPSAVGRAVGRLLDKKATRGRLLRRSRPNVRHNGAIRLPSARGKSTIARRTGLGVDRIVAAEK